MENLIIILFDLFLIGGYLLTSAIVALAIQFIVYQLTGFSIYKWIMKKIFSEI